MKRHKLILSVVALALVCLTLVTLIHVPWATAQDVGAAATSLPARWSYSAKFVCGVSDDPGNPPAEPDVKPGNYATKINIHNPYAQTVRLRKTVALAFPEGRDPIKPTRRFGDNLAYEQAMSVNCAEIVELLHKDNPTVNLPPFIEGFLVIDAMPATNTAALPELDVVAVYTAAQPSTPGAATGWVSSIDVHQVPGRRLPAMTIP